MKAGLIPLALATGVLIAAGVVVALTFGASGEADGTGSVDTPSIEDIDTSTLEGYFQAMNIAQTEISSGYATISAQYPEVFIDKQQTIDYLEASAGAWADAATTLETIDPPEEASTAHLGFIQATGDVGGAFVALGDTVEGTGDNEGALQDALDGADTSAFDLYSEACAALQTLADDNAITDETGAAIVLVC